jgi:hypothetical protein
MARQASLEKSIADSRKSKTRPGDIGVSQHQSAQRAMR